MRRILSAVVLIPVVVYLVLWAPPYFLFAAQLFLTLAGLWEFFHLAEAATSSRVLRIPGYTFATAVACWSLSDSLVTGILATATLFVMILLVGAMARGRSLSGYLGSVAATVLGVAYIAVPLALLVWVCRQRDGPFYTLFVLAVIWSGDSLAFLIGRAFGSHKSFPRLSPNKTWEGTAASLGAALLVGWIVARYFWAENPSGEPILLAALFNVAGQGGDLAESALKRNAGVKDSSQLIPGHGGVLDRIDALLFAAPVLWYYWLWKAS